MQVNRRIHRSDLPDTARFMNPSGCNADFVPDQVRGLSGGDSPSGGDSFRLKHKKRLYPGESLAPYRVGVAKALNTVPLIRGIEDQVIFAAPAELVRLLRTNELDAALVSIVEPLLTDRYDILDGVGIASLGEVKSVLLAHRKPLEKADVIFYDPDSVTGLVLLKVLLAERGLYPEFSPVKSWEVGDEKDYLLLSGDMALDFTFGPRTHEIFDLGTAWYELTRLPFVYEAWALRRGIENARLRHQLRAAKDFGMQTLDYIIRTRTEYTEDFRKDYLGWHIHYYIGSDEKRAIAMFAELLRRHGFGPVYEPRFVA